MLLIEGLIDTYHFPRMVSAYGMSAGLDLAEPVLDDDAPGEYALVGRQVSATPLSANRTVNGTTVTAAVIMREQNEQDGHYVPFELDDVKYRYGCFLGQLAATGTAVVAGIENDPDAPCP